MGGNRSGGVVSLIPPTPPEEDSLHWHALNYRTAQMNAETQAAWVFLEAFVEQQIERARMREQKRCADIANLWGDDVIADIINSDFVPGDSN